MTGLSDWPRNRLLLALPPRDLKRLMPELEHVRCERGRTLIDADSPLDHVFFPDSGVISVLAVYADGQVIEMATIGREGYTGVQAVFGAKNSSARYFALHKYPAPQQRCRAGPSRRPCGRCPPFSAWQQLTSRRFSSK